VTSGNNPISPVVDVHAHMVPPALLRQLHDGSLSFPGVAVTPHESTYRVAFNGGTPTRPIAPGLTDLQRRITWMDDNQVDLQLVGGWLDIFGYELSPDEGADWAQTLTAALRDATADEPRLVPLGSVPLQDPARAAGALRDQRNAGLPGVMIATRAGDLELDDPEFSPFWEAADETGAMVFLHPGFGGASPRYRDYGLVNGLARLEDTTVTLARLLYAGVPARFPGANLVVAHAGAALPYVLGRLARNHAMNPENTHDPLESFHRLHFDSVVFDPDSLGLLVGKAGAERVLLGSDYPFPIGDLHPRAVVTEAQLSHHQRTQIEGVNAERILQAVHA